MTATTKKQSRLVLVEWLDSHAGRGWQDMDRINAQTVPLYCRSVGWLVAESKDCKTIVPHIAGEKDGDRMMQGCGDLVIPTKAIVKTTNLQTAKMAPRRIVKQGR